jgi:hypothetical protein
MVGYHGLPVNPTERLVDMRTRSLDQDNSSSNAFASIRSGISVTGSETILYSTRFYNA